MKLYDFVMAGGGAAGLSLAYHLVRGPLRHSSILIVDRDAKDRDDRTWCCWNDGPTLFDDVVHHSWNRLHLVGEDFEKTVDLHPYRYQMIRGIDLYRFARERLSAYGNVEFLRGRVARIEDGDDRAILSVDGREYAGRWVFDSALGPTSLKPDPTRYHHLRQRFEGWEIETTEDEFDTESPTFFDFRTPQEGKVRFFYLLPISPRRALVEYVACASVQPRPDECELALHAYLQGVLGIREYQTLRREWGVSPMTDQPFPRRTGRHVMAIGALGGRIKPSTGYAFSRIQRDSAAIVRSLLRAGHPFDLPPDPLRYRLYDSIMLQVMYRHGERIKPIFTALFKNNPVGRVLRFLDEDASPWENLLLIATLPPQPFLQALFRLRLLHRL